MGVSLTPRRKQILDYLHKYTDEHGYAPTIHEICKYFNLSSTATVHKHLTALEQLGLIDRLQHRTRAIEFKTSTEEGSLQIPLLGRIAAGRPIEAILIQETVSVPKDMLGRNRTFALKVQGDSMIEEGIFDKDLIVVQERRTADNGEIVVALIDGQNATVKKFVREKNRVRLQPANPKHSALLLEPDRIQIQGVVIGLLRYYRTGTF
ncbi:MAG: transcriptional repressor LexA [Blastocatellia bacterium]|nr:transcriptional repressor LexA [Blastocatellia bacterium]